MTSRRARVLLCGAIAGVGANLLAGSPAHSVASPGTYELQAELELSLFAQEPQIVDPVALAFDGLGRAYVVEMRDYPYGFGPERKPGGTVRVLEDADGDGRADRSTLFAEGLSFPTSITPWRDGVLVAAPPQIVFLKDTDGDGRADVREVVVDGFVLAATDSNLNGLRYGLDNWIHGANGGNGGTVRSPRAVGATGGSKLGDRDFRLQPESGMIEPTAHTGGGFGLVFDTWGRSFTTYNINHLQQRFADARWFERFPGLPVVRTTQSISDHEDMARIYAVSPAQTRPNHPEQAGYFSAAGGLGILAHRGWPAALQGATLVGDVVGNLVHRDVLVPDGPVLRATRAAEEQTREFFASRDPSFRPVGFEPGPDGAMYLIDMQRDVIEHPDYIPKPMLAKLDVRAGDDRGRIYRVAPKGWPRVRELPGKATPEDRVALLGSDNPWTRITAQRLLVEQSNQVVVPALRKLAGGPDPVARVHALWTLAGLGALDHASIGAALGAAEAPVRMNALHLLGVRAGATEVHAQRVIALLDDDDPEVRFHAALRAGDLAYIPGRSLRRLLQRDHRHAWTRRAVLSSLGPRVLEIAPGFFADEAFWRDADAGSTRAALAEEFGEVMTATTTTGEIGDSEHARATVRAIDELLTATVLPMTVRVAAWEGAARGLRRRAIPLGGDLSSVQAHWGQLVEARPAPATLGALVKLRRALGLPAGAAEEAQITRWLTRATDSTVGITERLEIVKLLALAELRTVGPVLFGFLRGTEPAAIQQAALEILREHAEPEVGVGLVAAWPSLPPTLRAPVVNLLVYRHSFHEALLGALESGALQVGELNLDLEHRRELLRHASPTVRQRAAKLVSDGEYSNRKQAVDEWLAKLPAAGDATRGRTEFEQRCAQCHHAAGLGFRVGPELGGMGHRSVEDLLSNILDPNMAMNPAFVAYTAELRDGESETGILAAETAGSVTLIQAGGRRVELPRAKVKELRSTGRSLMPEGLEAGLTPQGLRDVIAFLQAPAADIAPGTTP